MKQHHRGVVALGGAAVAAAALVATSAQAAPAPPVDGTYVVPFQYTGTDPAPGKSNALQGIKGGDTPGTYLIVGTSFPNGFVYEGPIDDAPSGSGTWTNMNVPASYAGSTTSIYGVDNLDGTDVALVGSYKTTTGSKSFYYEGPITSTPDASDFTSVVGTKNGKSADYTFLHSVSGGLVVGNLDMAGDKNPAGYAFIYDPATNEQTPIVYPRSSRSLTHTAYGIWWNGGSSYTISGGQGLSKPAATSGRDGDPIGVATLIDYNSATGAFTNFRTFSFPKGILPKKATSPLTHFEGIWGNGSGSYQLPVTTTYGKNGAVAAVATVTRTGGPTSAFGTPTWQLVSVPGAKGVTTNNSVYDGALIGIANVGGSVKPWAFAPAAP